MSELGREELLAHLDWWRKVAHIGSTCERGNTCNQAYKQIKALIQKPEVTEETLIEKINRGAKEKSGATEELIDERAKELLIKANILIQTPEAMQQQLKILKDFIRSLVEEIT